MLARERLKQLAMAFRLCDGASSINWRSFFIDHRPIIDLRAIF
jgi:hypothetical protein